MLYKVLVILLFVFLVNKSYAISVDDNYDVSYAKGGNNRSSSNTTYTYLYESWNYINKTNINYTVVDGARPPLITQESFKSALSKAFRTWSTWVPVNFREVGPHEHSQVQILWHLGERGDEFNCPDKILAHAKDTFIHFSLCNKGPKREWVVLNECSVRRRRHLQIDVESIALHEIGHVLGLAHSDDRRDLTFATYSGCKHYLGRGEVEAAQKMYGVRKKYVPPPLSPPSNHLRTALIAGFAIAMVFLTAVVLAMKLFSN